MSQFLSYILFVLETFDFLNSHTAMAVLEEQMSAL